jgi:hypothetical protein
MAISINDLKEWLGGSPPPLPGEVASAEFKMLGLTSVLRISARSAGVYGNEIKVDILNASSLLPTQRDVKLSLRGTETHIANLDISVTSNISEVLGNLLGDDDPVIRLEKLASGTPDLVSGIELTGGKDPIYSFNLTRLIASANILAGDPEGGSVAFFQRNSQITRGGSWGQAYWDTDKASMTQIQWDTMLLDLLASLDDPTE